MPGSDGGEVGNPASTQIQSQITNHPLIFSQNIGICD